MEKNQVYQVLVRGSQAVGEVHHFWSNIHFHPTDAIEDDWGRRILDQVSRDGAARYVRIYAMLEDVVSKDAKGRLRYDFEDTDRRIDYLIQKGFRLLICFNFLPKDIAADPECMSWLVRYKGKHINTSKPADYREWQEVCRTYTEHLKDRYGEKRLAEWYFHCWNEPDFPNYFLSDMSREGHMAEAAEEYAKLYDHFAQGVTEGCEKVKIGGPSAALSNEFIEIFLRHVKGGKNWAHGKTGSRIDFLSVHTYGAFPKDLAAGKQIRVEDTYERVKELEKIAAACGFEKPEIVVDEWGLSTEGFTDGEKYPVLNFRNTELYAAAYAHMINYYVRHKAPVSMQMICLSGQHHLTREFHGYRSFFTLHGFPKPIYNAYVLCARLGSKMLEGRIMDGRDMEDRDAEGRNVEGQDMEGRNVEGQDMDGRDVEGQDMEDRNVEGQDMEDRNVEGRDMENRIKDMGILEDSEKNSDKSFIGVFPTIHEGGRIAVLLYRFFPLAVMEEQRIRCRTARKVHLEISDLWGRYRISHYRIDHDNANAYTAWRELGGRDDLSLEETEWIRREGEWKLWYPAEETKMQGQWHTDIVMTDNAVSLVELEPLNEIS